MKLIEKRFVSLSFINYLFISTFLKRLDNYLLIRGNKKYQIKNGMATLSINFVEG